MGTYIYASWCTLQTCKLLLDIAAGYCALLKGLKALFRPMTVMVPDLVLICENMLMAEGFIEAKVFTWSIKNAMPSAPTLGCFRRISFGWVSGSLCVLYNTGSNPNP